MAEYQDAVPANRRGSDKAKPDRSWTLVLACIAVLCLAGWAYLIAMVVDMVPVMDMSEAGPGMGLLNQFNVFRGLPAEARAALAVICLPTEAATFGMPTSAMTLADLFRVFLMWSMMSLAMMLPSAVPMLRAYATRLAERPAGEISAAVPVLLAVAGYLTVWLGYAMLATLFQWGLSKVGALNSMMAPASMALTTTVLFAAGVYQFTPAKKSCLLRCWYPRWVFAHEPDRAGPVTGYREGLVQGRACLGCCWAVMTVMFAVGLMNVLWIAILGAVMALEKSWPNRLLPNVIGTILILWALLLAFIVYSGAAPV